MGSHIRSKAVNHGYNWDKVAFRDNMYVRCSRCGFINNLDRELRSHPGGWEGWGTTMTPVYDLYDLEGDTYDYNTNVTQINWTTQVPQYSTYGGMGTYGNSTMTYGNYVGTAYGDTYDGLVEDTQDAVVNAGCCQCGSLLYNNPSRGTKG